MSHAFASMANDFSAGQGGTSGSTQIGTFLQLWGLHIRQFTYPRRKCRCERLWLETLLKIPPIIRPESLVLLASLYFTFCLYSKMIQLGKIMPFFVIKNVMDIMI